MSKENLMKLKPKNKSQKVSQVLGTFALMLGLCVMTALPANAAEDTKKYDDVYINGYKLGFFEQIALEDFINADIEDGNYWFELDTGMWGHVGEPPLGHIKVPEDYREYVESRLSNQNQAAKVDLATGQQECEGGCLYW